MQDRFGFWVLSALNISLCAVPKGGSTMTRQVVGRLAGLLEPGGKCWLPWGAPENAALYERGLTRRYNPNVTNILVARDPWTRAVSEFSDQIKREHTQHPLNPEGFLLFLELVSHHVILLVFEKRYLSDNLIHLDLLIVYQSLFLLVN